jgi:hypothetical protein
MPMVFVSMAYGVTIALLKVLSHLFLKVIREYPDMSLEQGIGLNMPMTHALENVTSLKGLADG